MEKILYAEDEAGFRRLVTMFLEKEHFKVITAEDGKQALELLGRHPDTALVILDVMMPKLNGIETCRAIRAFSTIPILMLTALGAEQNEVSGLSTGADDYIAKPFSERILVTRVKALLRRAAVRDNPRISYRGIVLDEASRRVTVSGERIELTLKEFELLRFLLANSGTVLDRTQILNKVWGYMYEGDPRTLDTHIKSLRDKLGEAGSMIKTHRSLGYSFEGDKN
jgi:two-component system, OmpR family, response regulator ResD